MRSCVELLPCRTSVRVTNQHGSWRVAALALCVALQGCAALVNPVANGIPVRRLPPELLGPSRENQEILPLSLLRQKPPAAYRLAPGDILGVWIEGVLGERGQAPPVQVSELGREAPALGYPIPVRSNGTISLPLVPPIRVEGMTLEQAEDAVRRAYTVERQILKPGRERIIVTLLRPRQYHVLVIRQDSPGGGTPETPTSVGGAAGGATRSTGFVLNIGAGVQGARRGTGFAIDLPAYENDVLNALARTGGFPGRDAVNEIIIERGSFTGEQGREDLMNSLQACPPEKDPLSLAAPGTRRIRIPLRYPRGQRPMVRPEDVILQTGDIVYIEAREADVYYTAGLLPAGEYQLPRDTDLDVVQAITRIGGSINAAGISTLNLSGQLLVPGFGNPSPTLVSIIRRTPGCGQVVIRVDLDRALRDPRERIVIQPRDIIVLQERPEEAIARYFSQVTRFNFFYQFVRSSRANVTGSFTTP